MLTKGAQTTTEFGPGNGSIFLSNVVCYGYESSVLDCYHNTAPGNCDHSQDVGIICEGVYTHVVAWQLVVMLYYSSL